MSDFTARRIGKWLLPHIKEFLKSVIITIVVLWAYLHFVKTQLFGLQNIKIICICGIIRNILLFFPKLHIYRNQSLKDKTIFVLTSFFSIIALVVLISNENSLGNKLFILLGNNYLLFSLVISLIIHIIEIPSLIIVARGYNGYIVISDNQKVNELYNQGIFHYDNNDYDNAIECFQKIIKILPDQYETNIMLGKIAVRYPERFSEIMGEPPDWVKNDKELVKTFKDEGLM
jgi:tetratricopeptide (TPR) repeat protein